MENDEYTAHDPKRWIALFVIAAATLMIVLDVSIINIALPEQTEISVLWKAS